MNFQKSFSSTPTMEGIKIPFQLFGYWKTQISPNLPWYIHCKIYIEIWIIPMHQTITFYPGLKNSRLSQGVYWSGRIHVKWAIVASLTWCPKTLMRAGHSSLDISPWLLPLNFYPQDTYPDVYPQDIYHPDVYHSFIQLFHTTKFYENYM
jgi:hypothetical protein